MILNRPECCVFCPNLTRNALPLDYPDSYQPVCDDCIADTLTTADLARREPPRV